MRVQRTLGILSTKNKIDITKDTIPSGKDRSNFSCEKYAFFLLAPFEISNRCCTYLKKNVSKKYEKETGRHPITAQMASESRLRTQQWLKNGCNGFDMKHPISNPMSFWTEQDVLMYCNMVQNDWDFWWRMATYPHLNKRRKKPYRKKLKAIGYRKRFLADSYGDIVQEKQDGQLEGQMNIGDFIGYEEFDLDRPLLKTTKCDRTGCFACGFGCHIKGSERRFANIDEIESPKIRDWIMRGGEWSDEGKWIPGRGGLGYWFVLKWINIYGNFNIEIPEFERYQETYGDERTYKELYGKE